VTLDDLLQDEPRRPIWLVTLADLMLLLVGFFAWLQANPALDAARLSAALRDGFGMAAEAPIALEANVVAGFAPGSAAPPAGDVAAWVRATMMDPRTIVRVSGGTDGTPADVDPATGSAAILAADRARAVAAALAREVAPDRIALDVRPGAGRAVQLTLSYAQEPR